MASISPENEERIVYKQGDLFSCPETDALAHCISEDCHMSAGIAAVFKKKFGGVQELLNQQKKTGDVAVLKRDNQYVYYLITKNKYFHKPTYDNLQKSLEAMKLHCVENGVTRISMPKIGCGLDRLEWEKVSTMLEEVFEVALLVTGQMLGSICTASSTLRIISHVHYWNSFRQDYSTPELASEDFGIL